MTENCDANIRVIDITWRNVDFVSPGTLRDKSNGVNVSLMALSVVLDMHYDLIHTQYMHHIL